MFGSVRSRTKQAILLVIACSICCQLRAGTVASSTVLATSPSPSLYGAPVTLIATVFLGATGQVTFYDGATVLGVDG